MKFRFIQKKIRLFHQILVIGVVWGEGDVILDFGEIGVFAEEFREFIPEGFAMVFMCEVGHFVKDNAVKPFSFEYKKHRRKLDDIIKGALAQAVLP